MIVYVDLIFIINLIFDYVLLLTVDLLLKRKSSYLRVFLGSLGGELSLLTLFIPFNKITLTIFKLVLTFIMSTITFKYKSLKYTLYNSIYLYLVGIILGGFIYYLYNEFQINLEYSFKYIVMLFISPIILLIYYKLNQKLKIDYQNRCNLKILYNGNTLSITGFFDSGNKLVSPYGNKPIILVEKRYIELEDLKLLPVPFNALNHTGIVFCFKPDEVLINENKVNNVLIGISEINFNIDGCNALINKNLEGYL